jgi:hypothetical protein
MSGPTQHGLPFEMLRHRFSAAVPQHGASSDTSRVQVPFWNPKTGIFDPAQLRLAIVMRGWTVVEFAKVARVSRGCLYGALLGSGVTDRTAIRIFQTLATRDPFTLTL